MFAFMTSGEAAIARIVALRLHYVKLDARAQLLTGRLPLTSWVVGRGLTTSYTNPLPDCRRHAQQGL